MKKAIVSGSFDPMTLGHQDIIERASKLFDEVVVLVGRNKSKNSLFTVEERVDMIRSSLSFLPNVTVDSFSGLIVDYATTHGCGYIVRGLRNSSDFLYEQELEVNNRFLSPSIETVYLTSRKENMFIRSSSVREFLLYGVDCSSLVPAPVYKAMLDKGLVSRLK